MVIPLPSALSDFSKTALTAINSLSAIQKAISNPQAVVQDNITKAATAATAGVPGDLFGNAQGFVSQNNQSFLGQIASPKALDLNLQQSAAGDLFGTKLTTGSAVDGYLNSSVRIEDVIPAQQIYQITKNLGVTSLYSDPLQAYAHVTTGSADIRNLCQEAVSIISSLQADLTSLLSLQSGINYSQYASMGPSFFLSASELINGAIAQQSILCTQLQVRGRFDPSTVSALCSALDAFVNFITFANAKILEFDILRKKIDAAITRLRQIGQDLVARIQSMIKFIPDYVISTSIGKLFQALQAKVCAQANINLGKILSDITAFTSLNADDRAKVNATFAMAGTIQSIKSFICGLQPSTDVVDPLGPFAPLKTAYDAFTSSLGLNDPTAAFASLNSQADVFSALMNTAVIQNNAVDLAAGVASIGVAIASLGASMAALIIASGDFKAAFVANTQLDPSRVVGATDLYGRIGADNAREISIAKAGDTTALGISESTTPGQLAESIKTTIDVMPEGNERDQLVNLHSEVLARHRATILAMDFTRREDIRTFFAPDEAEANRELVDKTIKTYSGIPKDQFNPVV